MKRFVRVSRKDGRYLELDDGTTYVPIGCNLCVPGRDNDALDHGRKLLDLLARHGGNFARLWVSSPGFDMETSAGIYRQAIVDRLRAFIDHARDRGIRVKMTLEYFRNILPTPEREHLLSAQFFARPIYHTSRGGPLGTMQDYLESDAGKSLFLRKLDLYAGIFADDPAVFGWELWNEMNCIGATGWDAWTQRMLGELRARFPRHLVMQSLGSLDSDGQLAAYETLARVPGQDIAQVHRYLDEGARWTVCHGPVDVSIAESMGRLRALYPTSPLLMAETGAVEPRHAGPWRHYGADVGGAILHDVVFGGFFTGGCGAGQCWHWDAYIERNDLWWQFARLAKAIEGIDPAAEHFTPFATGEASPQLRVYGLRGRTKVIAWVRDGGSDWRSEFERREPPAEVREALIDLPLPSGDASVRCYDPGADTWKAGAVVGGRVSLSAFRRSLVVVLGS